MPLFVVKGKNRKSPVSSMPGIHRLSIDLLVKECCYLRDLGIPAAALFPVIDSGLKDKNASESLNDKGLYAQAIRAIKSKVKDFTVITDVALDPYSSDGHDGLVSTTGEILNDETLIILAKQALCQAKAGADIVAPSGMMDGRVAYIRKALDEEGYKHVGILSYSAKYASSYYGPFRDALDSKPKKGNKKTYQINPANIKEALREVEIDIKEGADIVMVKPGLPYLDVVHAVSQISSVPVAVYNVSGEYAMLKAAGLKKWIDYEQIVLESLLGFKRAGADIIFSYHAKEVAAWLK